MAYVVIFHRDQEVVRRKLEGSITIGRSPECDLAVHDILLSRKHCRIDAEGDGWIVTDLGSKNGTRIGGTPVFRLPLTDGDVVRMGKTAIRFLAGEFVPATSASTNGLKRPADPFEALAGTVTDFTFIPFVPAPNGIPMPTPKPSPREPDGYVRDDVRAMVSELVSSSWDSIYEMASRPDPVLPQASIEGVRRKRPREPRIDLALQVHPEPAVEFLPLPPLEPAAGEIARAAVMPVARPRREARFFLRHLAIIAQWLALVMIIPS